MGSLPIYLLSFLALVTTASADVTCKVMNTGQYQAFDGTSVKGSFPPNCYVPLAASDCGLQQWLVVFDTRTNGFYIRYNNVVSLINPGDVVNHPGVTVTVTTTNPTLNQNRCNITIPQQPPTVMNCTICTAYNFVPNECVAFTPSPPTTTEIPTTPELSTSPPPSTEAPSSTEISSSPPPSSVAPIFNPGFCVFSVNGSYKSFDGTETDGSFPSDCVVPLASSDCSSSATWQVVFDEASSACSVVFEGVITTLTNGGLFFNPSLIVIAFGSNIFIIVPEKPVGVDCSVCSKPGLSECIAFPSPSPFSPKPTSAPFSTVVPILPPGFCMVKTSGIQYRAYDGTEIRGDFPPDCVIPVASSDCTSDKAWQIVLDKATGTVLIIANGESTPLLPGTIYFSDSVVAFLFGDTLFIIVPQQPTDGDCSACSAPGIPTCIGLPSGTPPSIGSSPSEVESSPAPSSPSPSSVSPILLPGFCVFSSNGSYTSFDGTETDGSFPADCVVPLASSDCSSSATWQVVFDKATSACSVVFEGVITTLSNGGIFFQKSLIVFFFGGNVFIIVPEQPAGLDCSVCSKPGLSECIAFPSPAPFSPSPSPFSTLFPVFPPGFCMVKTSGIQYKAYDGTEIRGNFPPDCIIPLASSDCGSEKAWQIVLEKATGTVLIIANGETTPLQPGTVFVADDFVAFIFGDTVFIVVPHQPTDGDCAACSAPGIPDCISLPSGTPPSIGSSPSEFSSELPSSLVPSSEASVSPASPSSISPILLPGFCVFSSNGSYTSFDGTETDGSFPSDCVVPLASSDCSSSATWQVVFDKATSACSVVFEGVITTLSNGGIFFQKSLIVFFFGDKVFIIVPEQPSGVDCSVCSKPGLSECIAFPSPAPFSPSPSPFSTLFPIIPPGFCMVKTSGIQYKAYDGTEIRGNFPPDCIIPLASSDCGSEKAWQIVLEKATGAVLIIANGETTPLQPGTVFVADDFVAFIFGDTVFIVVPHQPTDGDCAACSAPGIPDCISLPSGTPPSIGSSPFELSSELPSSLASEASPASPASSSISPILGPGFCLVSTNGSYKSFDGTQTDGSFPADCVVPLASSDCSSEAKWQVVLNEATSACSVVYEGVITLLEPGTLFFQPDLVVIVFGNNIFILVPEQPSGVDCSICSRPGFAECIAFPSPSPFSPSPSPFSTLFPISPPGFCEVQTNGNYRAYDGTQIRGNYPTDCIIPLASSDCGNDKAWQITMDKATGIVYITSEGDTKPLLPGQIVFGPDSSFVAFIVGNAVFIAVPSQPSDGDCSICSAPGIPDCLSFSSLPSSVSPGSSPAGTSPSGTTPTACKSPPSSSENPFSLPSSITPSPAPVSATSPPPPNSGFCELSSDGKYKAFDGTQVNGDFPPGCVIPLASNDCSNGDNLNAWQVILDTATDTVYITISGVTNPLAPGGVFIGDGIVVLMADDAVFVIAENLPEGVGCSVCSNPGVTQCLNIVLPSGTPSSFSPSSSPFPYSTLLSTLSSEAYSSLPPCPTTGAFSAPP